jgi:nucleotide-binding universal stress UspA family protein
VLAAAIALSERVGATLVLFRAVGLPHDLPAQALSASPDEVGRILVEEARRALEVLEAEVPAPLRGGVRVSIGVPWRALVDAARTERVDLIAIGSHGYGGIDRLIGTTAARVVDHADRSVWVVRPTPPATSA